MSQGTTRGVSSTVLACVVLASGALFGEASLTLLRHLAIDPASVGNGLMTGQGAPLRLTLAWWACWLVAVLAFFVGRASAALTRVLVANWWRFRALRLLCAAAAVLALATIGHLPAGPTGLGGAGQSAIDLGILVLSTVLAALGARTALMPRPGGAPAPQPELRRRRAWSPVRGPSPVPHGGSMNAGLPTLAMRRGQLFVRPSRRSGRRAAAVMLIGAAVAALSAAGSSAVVLTQMSALGARDIIVSRKAVTGAIRGPTKASPVRTDASVGAAARTTGLGDPTAALAPLPVRQPPAVAGAFAMATPDERELTFAKGYARRRAALEAAGLVPAKPPSRIEVRRERGATSGADRRDRLDDSRGYDRQRTSGGG